MGPMAYVVATSDLHPEEKQNKMCKYADDAYLLVPECASNTADAEIVHLENWAQQSNLKLNRSKCRELLLTRGRVALKQPPPPLASGIERVQESKVLGVILRGDLSMSAHVQSLETRSSQALYALKVLKSHGLQGEDLHLVSKAHLEARLGYALPAWRGFATQEQLQRLQRVCDRAHRWQLDGGHRLPSIEELGDKLDSGLFRSVIHNTSHVLHRMLPPEREIPYSLRKRAHNFQLVSASCSLRKNFLQRMLFLQSY